MDRSVHAHAYLLGVVGAVVSHDDAHRCGATSVCLAVHPDVADKTGLYFDSCKVKQPSEQARDGALADRLWAERTNPILTLIVEGGTVLSCSAPSWS